MNHLRIEMRTQIRIYVYTYSIALEMTVRQNTRTRRSLVRLGQNKDERNLNIQGPLYSTRMLLSDGRDEGSTSRNRREERSVDDAGAACLR